MKLALSFSLILNLIMILWIDYINNEADKLSERVTLLEEITKVEYVK
jgi:hypothetical protein